MAGESGCGKSVTALSILGLLPPRARVLGGSIELHGVGDLLALPEAALRTVRGRRIGMIFQEPMTALNPVLTIGFQLVESLRLHRKLSRRMARREAERLLALVAMPDPRARLGCYPHELSGGQRQRAMIAIALASEPDLLIADEPTTALDVTVQSQVLALLQELQRSLGLAVLLITHDLGVIAECCDRVLVMYAGQVVEEAPSETLFRSPAHPYARALLAARPMIGRPASELEGIPGQVPDPSALPSGCTFHPRCAYRFAPCDHTAPPLFALSTVHRSRCLLHAEPAAGDEPS